MDLGTVDGKLAASRYATVEDFAKDIRLIWTNAQTFNLEGSDIYELATMLSRDFENRMAEVKPGPLREGAPGKAASSSGASETLSGEALSQCKAIVRDLRKHKDAAPFLDPVDWKALGLKDYPAIIKRPMDLGTIMKRLETGQYDSVLSVASDIDQVWANAMAYNQDASYIYAIAAELKSYADKKMAPLVAAARALQNQNGPLREGGAAKGAGSSGGGRETLSGGEALSQCKAVVRDYLVKHTDARATEPLLKSDQLLKLIVDIYVFGPATLSNLHAGPRSSTAGTDGSCVLSALSAIDQCEKSFEVEPEQQAGTDLAALNMTFHYRIRDS
jgi:hypothetical protein